MLEVTNVSSGYGSFLAVEQLSLSVEQGEIVALLGANGAGKSTILKTISGLLNNVTGNITWRGDHIDNLTPREIVEKGIIHCPEGRQVFPDLTVMDNLRLGFYTRRGRKDFIRELNSVYEILPRLKERTKQLAGTLSGGEQQMLAIGRALMSRPKLLLLDEPSLGLAPRMVDEVAQVISQLNQSGVTILLVEQSVHVALQLANRAYVLAGGKIVLTGQSDELKANPRLQDIYLGADTQSIH